MFTAEEEGQKVLENGRSVQVGLVGDYRVLPTEFSSRLALLGSNLLLCGLSMRCLVSLGSIDGLGMQGRASGAAAHCDLVIARTAGEQTEE